MDEIIEKTKDYVRTCMEQNDKAHDFEHIMRVYHLCEDIMGECDCEFDPFLVKMCALLHDIEDHKLDSSQNCSVKEYLDSIGLSDRAGEILSIIDGVSFSKNPKKNSDYPIEGQIVQDADRIDAIGAIGIARTFAYGGKKNRPIREGVTHFEEKLMRLYDELNTQAGKKIAKPRHDYLCSFYKQIVEEMGHES